MRDRTKQREEMKDVEDRDIAKGMKLKNIDRNKGRYSISRKMNRKKERKKEKAQGGRVAGRHTKE